MEDTQDVGQTLAAENDGTSVVEAAMDILSTDDVPVQYISDDDSIDPDVQELPKPTLNRFQKAAENLHKELHLFIERLHEFSGTIRPGLVYVINI